MKKFLATLILCVMILASEKNVQAENSPIKQDLWDPSWAMLADWIVPSEKLEEVDDDLLMSTMNKDDYDFMKKNSKGVFIQGSTNNNIATYDSETGLGQTAGYEAANKRYTIVRTYIEDMLSKGKKAQLMASLHHETQHLKDFLTFSKKTGYSQTIMSFKDSFDSVTTLTWHAILEARAYAEEALFIYEKMQELENIIIRKYGSVEELENTLLRKYGIIDGVERSVTRDDRALFDDYYDFKKEYTEGLDDNIIAFRNAIQAGKQKEEARHITEVVMLNSCHFKDNYMEDFKHQLGTRHLDFRQILEVFDDDKLTMNDLYAAENFWIEVCKYVDTMDTDECRFAKIRYVEKHCGKDKLEICKRYNSLFAKYFKVPNSRSEDFDVDVTFRKMDKVFEVDGMCTAEACEDKRRILTNDEDRMYYILNQKDFRTCCTLDWNFFYSENENACCERKRDKNGKINFYRRIKGVDELCDIGL